MIWCKPGACFFILSVTFMAAKVVSCQAIDLSTGPAVKQEMKNDSARIITKSPTGAMLRSLTIPGWGQWYNEKPFKAFVVAAGEIGLIVDIVLQNQKTQRSNNYYDREFYRNNRNLAMWWLAAVILYGMADAYVDAHLYHFDESTDLSLAPIALIDQNESQLCFALSMKIHF